jgi:hypothetical protein
MLPPPRGGPGAPRALSGSFNHHHHSSHHQPRRRHARGQRRREVSYRRRATPEGAPASGESAAGDGGWGGWWTKAQDVAKQATKASRGWASQTQDALTTQVNEKVKLLTPSMEVAVDHFGPTARQISKLLKPVTEPIKKQWMTYKPETRRMIKGGGIGAFVGNLILGWPARSERKALQKKVRRMEMERTKMLVDDFSLEREVLTLNAENRRLEKRVLRAEMALNAIKRRLSEYAVTPKDDAHFADPQLVHALPGAPWANSLIDAVANGGTEPKESAPPATMNNSVSTKQRLDSVKAKAKNAVDSGNGSSWSRRDDAWALAATIASEEAGSDGGERPTAL